MKFVTFTSDAKSRPGLWLDHDRVLDLGAAAAKADARLDASSLLAIIRGGAPALAVARALGEQAVQFAAAIHPLADVKLEAPIPQPARNVFCVGRNYLDHIAEGARALGLQSALPKVPQFFTKATHAVIGPDTAVRLDAKVSPKLDYEVELGVVIGKTGRDIAPEAVFEHIFGYTIVNDVSARDLQRMHEQWFKGKSLDTCCPMGPCIVERDEIGDPSALELSITINGEERQRARVSQMIFDIARIVSDLSAGMTLEAGDVIATGTPSGVGFAMEPPKFLKDGDVMVCTISKIGSLRNTVLAVR
jgi:2-keto-4-pentenoate hydratase/2-oxohepta-3-ene-1,7-dioic acid hydratase in catechol pathway